MREYVFGGDLGTVVHPGVTYELAAIYFQVDPSSPALADLEVAYEIAADDFPLSRGKLQLTAAEILRGLSAAREEQRA